MSKVEKTEKADKKPEWFSIREAAKYLSIGEPTLYRWMRDGKITFRKIGDSTRFLKEDLDAVIQVYHSKSEAEKVKLLCPVCHSDDIVNGIFRTTGLNYFVPEKAKFWTLHDRNIKTTAIMCARCGAITLFGNLDKLAKIRGKESPETGDETTTNGEIDQ